MVPHTAKAKRTMTRHVVTRWYRAPELILLQAPQLQIYIRYDIRYDINIIYVYYI